MLSVGVRQGCVMSLWLFNIYMDGCILMRLINMVAENVLPECQCGFRKNCSTSDIVFVAHQVQEKCREQHCSLCMVCVDLTKAFDTVNRQLLWDVLRKSGCPPKKLESLV